MKIFTKYGIKFVTIKLHRLISNTVTCMSPVIYLSGGDKGPLELCKDCEVNLGPRAFTPKLLGLVNINFCSQSLLY